MIAYFVHNLDSYSGAAQQALLLAKYINQDNLPDYPVIIKTTHDSGGTT